MKSKLILTLILSLSLVSLQAQVPQGFNYQAVATDANGSILANKDLQVMFGILSDTTLPVIVWEELHTGVRTNSSGIFNLVIGKGLRQAGVATFGDIKWAVAPLFIRIKINYLGTWYTMGQKNLWTVPYAMAAGTVSGSVNRLNVVSDVTSPDSALFVVRNNTGQIVFAVYNEGVRIYVDKGVAKVNGKGGFAVGGFSTGKAAPQDFFIVSPDSIRAYIDSGLIKTRKGGFAIGGFGARKGTPEEYMRVTRDSTSFKISDGSKAQNGGFSVGSISNTGSGNKNYVNLTKDNYYIGYQAGTGNTTGKYNSVYGYSAGLNNSGGNSNVFIGYNAGLNNLSGDNNTYIGYDASRDATTGSGNVAIGRSSGKSVGAGSNNVFIGEEAGTGNQGSGNVFIGYQSGILEPGSDKLYIGNSGSRQPLLWGDFAGGKMAVNTNNSLGYNFYVLGTGASLVPFVTASDIRLKENIFSISDPIQKVMNLRGVYFTWKDKSIDGNRLQMGLIAQELEKVEPELVRKGSDDHLSIAYSPLVALLIEAVKAQQKIIEEQKQRIDQLEKQQARIDNLEQQLNILLSNQNK